NVPAGNPAISTVASWDARTAGSGRVGSLTRLLRAVCWLAMLTRLPMAARAWRRPGATLDTAARIPSYKTARLLRRTDNTRRRHLLGPDNMREVSIGPVAVHTGG